MRSYNADTFCFELGDKTDPHDHYYFNGQKRGLPDYGIVNFSPDRCVALCRDKLGGMAVASKCTSLLLFGREFFFGFGAARLCLASGVSRTILSAYWEITA